MKQTLRTIPAFVGVLVGILVGTSFSGSAVAHARLQASTPADAATVSPAPKALRLQYNEAVEAPLCSVKVTGPNDAPVTTDKVVGDQDSPKTLVLALPPLTAGTYRAAWSAVGHDGHRTQGEIHFTVK